MHHPVDLGAWWPATGAFLLGVGYLALAVRDRRVGRRCSSWHTASFLAGCALLALALSPPLDRFAHADFRGHMLTHLLIGMLAPLGLVLGAPVTLVLRGLPARHARAVSAILRSRPLRVLTNPVVALTIATGSLPVLYFTPLYSALSEQPAAHRLVHLHFLASGYLFTWVIAGPDPAPRRPSVPARLVVLGVSVAVHATLSQLMYAGLLVRVEAPPEELRGAAEIMYYGGDIAELLLAFALVATWRPRRSGTPRGHPRTDQTPA